MVHYYIENTFTVKMAAGGGGGGVFPCNVVHGYIGEIGNLRQL